MKNMLKIEFKKLFKSKLFWVTLIIGCIIVALHTVWVYNRIYLINNGMLEDILSHDEYAQKPWFETGILQGWLGTDFFSAYNAMFYLIFPLIAAMPYGLSLFREWNMGYAAHIVTRGKRSSYFAAKYIVTFISGGMVVTIPLVLSFIAAACYIPVIPIDILAMKGIGNADMWADLYYEAPVLYALVFTVLNFIHGGIFASITVIISFWCTNGFLAMIFPLMINIFLTMGVANIYDRAYHYIPGSFINPAQKISYGREDIAILMTILLFVASVVLYALNCIKKDELE